MLVKFLLLLRTSLQSWLFIDNIEDNEMVIQRERLISSESEWISLCQSVIIKFLLCGKVRTIKSGKTGILLHNCFFWQFYIFRAGF